MEEARYTTAMWILQAGGLVCLLCLVGLDTYILAADEKGSGQSILWVLGLGTVTLAASFIGSPAAIVPALALVCYYPVWGRQRGAPWQRDDVVHVSLGLGLLIGLCVPILA